MKRFTLIIAAMAIALSCCAQKNSKMKTLVAYFSATGVTERVAHDIATATGGTLHKITPEQPYTAADLDWTNKQSRSSVEMADRNSRPAIVANLQNADQYDVIYIGFPIWWYTYPTIINTFLDTYKFEGKTLIPFATSGGSSINKSMTDFRLQYPNIKWRDGRLLNHPTEKDIKDWVKSNLK